MEGRSEGYATDGGRGIPLKKLNPSAWTFSSTESNNIFRLCMHEYVCVCVYIEAECMHAWLCVRLCVLTPTARHEHKGERETQRKRVKPLKRALSRLFSAKVSDDGM